MSCEVTKEEALGSLVQLILITLMFIGYIGVFPLLFLGTGWSVLSLSVAIVSSCFVDLEKL